MSGDSQQCPHNARFRISKVEVSDLIGYAVFSVDNFEALAPQLLTPKKFFKKKIILSLASTTNPTGSLPSGCSFDHHYHI